MTPPPPTEPKRDSDERYFSYTVQHSEAQKAQRHANKAREQAELQPVETATNNASSLLARLLGR